MRSMKRFPPKPARAVVLARGRKVSQVLESESGRAAIVGRYMIVIAMLPGTSFSRSDVTVSLEESPPFPRKRQSFTTEGGEDVKRLVFQGLHLGVWDSYGLAAYEFGAGCICEDSRGRWYLNASRAGTTHERALRPHGCTAQ